MVGRTTTRDRPYGFSLPLARPPRAYPCVPVSVSWAPRPISLSERGQCPFSIAAIGSSSQMFLRSYLNVSFSAKFMVEFVVW